MLGNPRSTDRVICRLGVVSYLNALPLIEGLNERPEWTMRPAVPSALAAMLAGGEVDVALLPVVDLARRRDELEIVSDGCIGCDGETMTVRVFAKAPPDRITRLRVDSDSHTSVILAQLVWRELYGRVLEVTPRGKEGEAFRPDQDAELLIGDKVVTERPRGFGFEVDLGAAWKHLTGLPMVFAVWTSSRAWCASNDVGMVARTLSLARDAGVARAAVIAEREGPRHGWPVDLARHYLTSALKYRIDGPMRDGMHRFVSMAEAAKLV